MNNYLLYLIIAVLVLTGIGVLGAVCIGGPPESAMSINPYADNVSYFLAYCCVALCFAGLFCIFIKSLRMPLVVIVCGLLLFFFDFTCWNVIFEGISYRVARRGTPVDCPFVIEEKDYTVNSLMIRFLDGKADDTVPADVPFTVFHRLNEGDTCVAVVWDGVLGIKFISKIKNVRRNSSNNS